MQEEREQQLDACGDTLQLLVDSIKGILSVHNQQLADVKHLLRAMAKVGGGSGLRLLRPGAGGSSLGVMV